MSDTVMNDNKRYLRFSRSHSHPTWLGFQDRFLFPPYEPEPSFFFIRKMNILGELYDEKKLIEWIQTKHFNNPPNEECNMEDASVLPKCLSKYINEVAVDNEIIVIPMNKGFMPFALNLICSLKNFDMTNIVYWSLDHATHDALLKKGKLSIFFAGFPTEEDVLKPDDKYFTKMIRFKPKLLAMLLQTGVNVWYMDADQVALTDFRQLVVNDHEADVFVATDLKLGAKVSVKPHTSTIYLRNSAVSKDFVKRLGEALLVSKSYDDLRALRWMVADTEKFDLIIPQSVKLVPKNPQQGMEGDSKEIPTDDSPDHRDKAIEVTEKVSDDIKKKDQTVTASVTTETVAVVKEDSNETNEAQPLVKEDTLVDTKDPTSEDVDLSSLLRRSTRTKIKMLDPLEFADGGIFKENSPILDGFQYPVLVHASVADREVVLQDWGLWYMSVYVGNNMQLLLSEKICNYHDSTERLKDKISKKTPIKIN
jgi:Nucleotide-diphospho-sugar transferase